MGSATRLWLPNPPSSPPIFLSTPIWEKNGMREPGALGLHFTTLWESLQRRTFYAIVMTGTKEFLMMGRLVDKFIAAASVQGHNYYTSFVTLDKWKWIKLNY